jgi:hypothetical protein
MRWLVVFACFACSNSVAPRRQRVDVGTYAYSSTVGGSSYRGTIEVVHASPDSLHAVWHVQGFGGGR